MKLKLDSRFAAENVALRIRWLLVIAAAGLLGGHLRDSNVIAALSALTGANVIGHLLCANPEVFKKFGRFYCPVLRFVDAVLISGASLVAGFPIGFLWVLGIPLLATEGIAKRDYRTVGLLTLTMMGIQFLVTFRAHGNPTAYALPLGSLLTAGVACILLASSKGRDDVLSSTDKRLSAVLECGSELAASCDLKATILHTLKSAVQETGATCGYVMLIDQEQRETLVTEVAYGADGDFSFPERIEVGAGMSGYVARMGQPISISSTKGEHQSYDGVTAGVRSASCVPLVTRNYTGAGQAAFEQVLGVMTLMDLHNGDTFGPEDMELLRTLGSFIAVAVSNAQMEERRRTTFLLTLESLATALEARDEYTRGHSQRVCDVSLMIGEKLGLGHDAIEELRVGTILHDIGKIGVPDAILNKRARLTDDEFKVMKSHPVIGYEICKPLMLSEGVLMIIRNHHEKLDGSGYPDGLKGGELPLSLRIVCVADAFDAMSSRRPYRTVMEHSVVLAELSRGAGTQFDPVVVENLKHLMGTERLLDLYKQYWDDGEPLAA